MSNYSDTSRTASTRPHSDDCSDRVIFILPQLPPAHCGLGDYSMILLGHMRMDPPPRILVMHGAAETRAAHPELDVQQLPGSQDGLLVLLRELQAKRVFVQYVAQGFQSRGCPLWFLGALRKWRVRTADAHLVIMFQELWFEPAFWKPDWLLQKMHRPALINLAGVADRVFVSAEPFRQRLRKRMPADQSRVLVNPATIPLFGSPQDSQRNQGLFVLFGRQGSRIAALHEMAPWIDKLHRTGWLTKLVLVGSRESTVLNSQEDSLVEPLLPRGVAEVIGPQPPDRLSELFLSARFGICAKTTHGYTKSTIFMGYASHGVSILSPETICDSSPALCWVTHPSELVNGLIRGEEVKQRGEKLASWYQGNASWEHVARVYRRALGLP